MLAHANAVSAHNRFFLPHANMSWLDSSSSETAMISDTPGLHILQPPSPLPTFLTSALTSQNNRLLENAPSYPPSSPPPPTPNVSPRPISVAWSIVICLSWWVSPAYSLFAPPQTAMRSHAALDPAKGEADRKGRGGKVRAVEEMKRVRMQRVGRFPGFIRGEVCFFFFRKKWLMTNIAVPLTVTMHIMRDTAYGQRILPS